MPMHAAVVEAFDRPPHYHEYDEPVPQGDEVLVTVHAAALSPFVRSQASGQHYSSRAPLPFVPGVDGVGQLSNGQRVYFSFARPPFGALAERVAVKRAYCVALPDDVDTVTAAAIANPGMSSWAALTQRAALQPGEAVLINGATGASGKLAIQIAKHLHAGRVIATGRNASSESRLRALGADAFIALDQSPAALTETFRKTIAEDGVDVVLDYLWGPSAEHFIMAAGVGGTGDAARRIRFVQIGALSGATIPLPATALRSSGIELLGSGLGSLSHAALMQVISDLMHAVVSAQLNIDAKPVPLTDVAAAWTNNQSGRIVFTL